MRQFQVGLELRKGSKSVQRVAPAHSQIEDRENVLQAQIPSRFARTCIHFVLRAPKFSSQLEA